MGILPKGAPLVHPRAPEPNPILAAQVGRVEARPDGRGPDERGKGEEGEDSEQDPVVGRCRGGPGVLESEEGADGGRERVSLV